MINTDQNPAYREAMRQLKRDDPDQAIVRGATLGFKSMKTAYAKIKGFEVMRMIRKRQCILLEPGVTGKVRFVNKLFDLAALIPAAERARLLPDRR